MTDESPSEPDEPADPNGAKTPAATAGSGLDLARAMLSRAKADSVSRRAGSSRRYAQRPRQRQSPSSSGSGPDDRDPQPLGRAVERLVDERGWQAAQAIGGVEGRWSQIVGPELAGHCQPEEFDDGSLTVRADSTAWASQVRLLAGTVLARLNNDLGAGTVTRLNVLGPAAPSWKKGKWSVKGRGPRDTYG
ncbi:MAG TPA: DciA family protein [Actinomycetes bacterium]|nr:DciA family protein [Actinomycetes bacterium]